MDADENPYKAPKKQGTEPPKRDHWEPLYRIAWNAAFWSLLVLTAAAICAALGLVAKVMLGK